MWDRNDESYDAGIYQSIDPSTTAPMEQPSEPNEEAYKAPPLPPSLQTSHASAVNERWEPRKGYGLRSPQGPRDRYGDDEIAEPAEEEEDDDRGELRFEERRGAAPDDMVSASVGDGEVMVRWSSSNGWPELPGSNDDVEDSIDQELLGEALRHRGSPAGGEAFLKEEDHEGEPLQNADQVFADAMALGFGALPEGDSNKLETSNVTNPWGDQAESEPAPTLASPNHRGSSAPHSPVPATATIEEVLTPSSPLPDWLAKPSPSPATKHSPKAARQTSPASRSSPFGGRGGQSWRSIDYSQPPSQLRASLDAPALDETGEEIEIELLYDPALNCYYDPKTNQYYEVDG